MRSLVTGGAGFIGSHLVDRLLELGHDVVVLDDFRRGNKLGQRARQLTDIVRGDVRREGAVMEAAKGCDLIFHFAAVLGVDCVATRPIETMETEALAAINVANAAAACGAEKIIYASTSGIYGRLPVDQAVAEDAAVSPKSGYAVAKYFVEHYLEAIYEERRTPWVGVRFFNVYGPRQDDRMVIPRFFNQAMHGQPITVYGSGTQTRDFTYVADAVDATVRLALGSPSNEVFNVAHGQERSIADLALDIKSLTGSRSEVLNVEPPANRAPFEVARRIGDTHKLIAAAAFEPTTSLSEGLAHVYASLVAPDMARGEYRLPVGDGRAMQGDGRIFHA